MLELLLKLLNDLISLIIVSLLFEASNHLGLCLELSAGRAQHLILTCQLILELPKTIFDFIHLFLHPVFQGELLLDCSISVVLDFGQFGIVATRYLRLAATTSFLSLSKLLFKLFDLLAFFRRRILPNTNLLGQLLDIIL